MSPIATVSTRPSQSGIDIDHVLELADILADADVFEPDPAFVSTIRFDLDGPSRRWRS